jgi:hypothetical protein
MWTLLSHTGSLVRGKLFSSKPRQISGMSTAGSGSKDDTITIAESELESLNETDTSNTLSPSAADTKEAHKLKKRPSLLFRVLDTESSRPSMEEEGVSINMRTFIIIALFTQYLMIRPRNVKLIHNATIKMTKNLVFSLVNSTLEATNHF